jgi:hypothetical protein
MIYIKGIPKDTLLFYLWSAARTSYYYKYCKDTAHTIEKSRCTIDIAHCIKNKTPLEFNSYHSRMLHVDITGDYLNEFKYEVYNKVNTKEVINKLKEELCYNIILNRYKAM